MALNKPKSKPNPPPRPYENAHIGNTKKTLKLPHKAVSKKQSLQYENVDFDNQNGTNTSTVVTTPSPDNALGSVDPEDKDDDGDYEHLRRNTSKQCWTRFCLLFKRFKLEICFVLFFVLSVLVSAAFTYIMITNIKAEPIVGPPGATGPEGKIGKTGPKGDAGVGLKGSKGAQGQKGANGVTGAKGIQGPKGALGPAGAKGTKGDKGDPGTASVPATPTGK